MKNRTVIGVICIVLAVLVTFLVTPLINALTTDTVKVLRLKADVDQGTLLQAAHLETVEVAKATVPKGILNDSKKIVGKFATTKLHSGDYVYTDSVSDTANSAEDIFAGLDGDKVAISIPVSGFAEGVSNKLQNADVISLLVTVRNEDSLDIKTYIPGALKYMRVITTTTSSGLDRDELVENEDGSLAIYSTITFLVTKEQAQLLTLLSNMGADMTAALVYRPTLGTMEKAEEYWDAQDRWLEENADDLTAEYYEVEEKEDTVNKLSAKKED